MAETPYNYDSLTSREGLAVNQCSAEDDIYGDCPKESAIDLDKEKQSLVPTDLTQFDDNYKCLDPSKHEGFQPIEVAKDGSRVWVSKEDKDPSAVNANTPERWSKAYKTTHGFRYMVKVNDYEQKTRQMGACFTTDAATGQKKFYAYKSIPAFEEKEAVRAELYSQVPGFDDLTPQEVAKIRAQIPDGLTYVTTPNKGKRSIRFLSQGSLDGLKTLLNWFNNPNGYSKEGAVKDPKARNYYLSLLSFLNTQIQQKNGGNFSLVFSDLTDGETLRIIKQLEQGGSSYVLSREQEDKNKISIPNGQFNPTMYKPATSLDEWLMERGGFSEGGCNRYSFDGHWFKLVYTAFTWAALSPGDDVRACQLSDSLEAYIQPMADAKTAKRDGIISGAFIAALSAVMLVPDMRQRAASQVTRIGRGVANIGRRLIGRQAVQEKPWENTFRELGVFDITEEIDNYLKNPEQWRAEHPKGWKDLDFVEVVGTKAEAEILEIKRGLEGNQKSSVVIVGNRGTGKTATAITFMIKARRGDFGPEWQKAHFLSLDKLGAGTSDDYRMDRLGASKRVAAAYLKAAEQMSSKGISPVGFGDEIHKLSTIGQYYQGGELVDKGFAEEIKPGMAAGTVRILGATTNQADEMGQFRKNGAFANRFNQIEQEPRTEADILEVMQHYLPQKETKEGVRIPDAEREAVLKGIIEICHRREGVYAARDPLALLDHLLKTKKDEGVDTLVTRDVHRILDERTVGQVASLAQTAARTFEKLPTPEELAEFERALLGELAYEQLNLEIRSSVKDRLVKLWKENTDVQEMYLRRGTGISGFVADTMKGDLGKVIERYAGAPSIDPTATPTPQPAAPAQLEGEELAEVERGLGIQRPQSGNGSRSRQRGRVVSSGFAAFEEPLDRIFGWSDWKPLITRESLANAGRATTKALKVGGHHAKGALPIVVPQFMADEGWISHEWAERFGLGLLVGLTVTNPFSALEMELFGSSTVEDGNLLGKAAARSMGIKRESVVNGLGAVGGLVTFATTSGVTTYLGNEYAKLKGIPTITEQAQHWARMSQTQVKAVASAILSSATAVGVSTTLTTSVGTIATSGAAVISGAADLVVAAGAAGFGVGYQLNRDDRESNDWSFSDLKDFSLRDLESLGRQIYTDLTK